MTLYKYLPAGFALDALQNGRLKVSRLNQLNDVFDCQPLVTVTGSPLAELMVKDIYQQEANEKYGLVSYCADPDHVLLWGHYADSGRGVAIGFEFLGGTYLVDNPKPGQRWLRKAAQIKYQEQRAAIDLSDIEKRAKEMNVPSDYLALIEGSIFKGKVWEYENEYREFVDLWHCQPVGIHYFMPFPSDQVAQIILGPACELSPQFLFNSFRAGARTGTRDNLILKKAKAKESVERLELEPIYGLSR